MVPEKGAGKVLFAEPASWLYKQTKPKAFVQSLTYFLNAGITGMHYCAQLYVVLGIGPKSSACARQTLYLLIPSLPFVLFTACTLLTHKIWLNPSEFSVQAAPAENILK